MFDRFTDRAKSVMTFARQGAVELNHNYICTEHILLGLVHEGTGVGACVLKNMEIVLEKIRQKVEALVEPGPPITIKDQVPFTGAARTVLELAMEEASRLRHNYIGTEHLLLGMIRENDGIAAQVLQSFDAGLDEARREALEFLGASVDSSADDESERARTFRAPGILYHLQHSVAVTQPGASDRIIVRSYELPFVPTIGLRVSLNDDASFEIEDLACNLDTRCFSCNSKIECTNSNAVDDVLAYYWQIGYRSSG